MTAAHIEAMRVEMMGKLEHGSVEMENRLREMITELISPALQYVNVQQRELNSLRASVNDHTVQIGSLFTLQSKLGSFTDTIDAFSAEIKGVEASINHSLVRMDDNINEVKVDNERISKSVESKESAFLHMQRSVDRAVSEVNRMQDRISDINENVFEKRLDETRLKANKMISELEAKIIALEVKHNTLADELWGEQTGLAKVTGELNKTNDVVEELGHVVKDVQSKQLAPEKLDQLRHEVAVALAKHVSEMVSLKRCVGDAVNDVQEHLRTGLQTASAYVSEFMNEVRNTCREEHNNVENFRLEIEKFVEQWQAKVVDVQELIANTVTRFEALYAEQREALEDADRKRKKDRTSSDNENRGLQKRLNGMSDSLRTVVKGLEFLGHVSGLMLEVASMQCALDQQDTVDREHMHLLGLREEAANPQSGSARGSRAESATYSPQKASPRLPRRRGAQVVTVDQRCMSCSGQAPTVLAAFKIACLQYNPSPVTYGQRELTRAELLRNIEDVLQKAHQQFSSGPRQSQSNAKPTDSAVPTVPLSEYAPTGTMTIKPDKMGRQLPLLPRQGSGTPVSPRPAKEILV